MKKNKLVLFSAILGMSLSMATGTIGAFAETGGGDSPSSGQIDQETEFNKTVKVTLHKKQYSEFPEDKIPNTGAIMSEFANVPGLNGVEFKVYDVSTEYYANLTNQTDTIDENGVVTKEATQKALEYVQGLIMPDTTEAVAVGTTNTNPNDDDEKGVVTFASLPLYSGNATDGYKYAVYLFVETTQEHITAQPLAIAFPIEDDETPGLDLYPKNEVQNRVINLQKVTTDGTAGKELEGIAFQLTKVENGVTKYYNGKDDDTGKAKWADAATNAIVIDEDGIVQLEGLQSGTYTLQETDDKERIKRTAESQAITVIIGKNGDIVEQSKTDPNVWVTDTDGIVKEDGNILGIPKANINLPHTEKAAINKIVVENRVLANLSFDKIERGTENPVAGATFKITKGGFNKDGVETKDATNTLYVKESGIRVGEYQYAWKSELATLSETEQANYKEVILDGETASSYKVEGLLAGTYYVWETKAAKGYITPTGASAYKSIDLFADSKAKDGDGVIKNMPKGALPSTGGSGIVIFLTMGSALMGGAIIMHRRNRKEAEEI